jgi:hypothetical protein
MAGNDGSGNASAAPAGGAGATPGGAAGAAPMTPAASGAGGEGGTLLFEARHETDLSEWTGDGPDSGGIYVDDEPPMVSAEQVHSGTGAVRIFIDTSNDRAPICRLYHRVTVPAAYYGAWFYVTQDHVSFDWWMMMLFKAQPDVEDITSAYNLWDIGQMRSDDGYTTYVLYDHLRTENRYTETEPALPIGRWFHLEAYLSYAAGQQTELEVWLDGQSFLHLTDLEPPPQAPLFWSIGNGGSQLVPAQSTIFIDDVTISTTRVGLR